MAKQHPVRVVKMPVNVSLYELDLFAKKINCVLQINHGDITLLATDQHPPCQKMHGDVIHLNQRKNRSQPAFSLTPDSIA